VAEFCPNCGVARAGTLRFCQSCGLDFDSDSVVPPVAELPATAEPVTRTPIARRLPLRRLVGTGMAMVVGLALLAGATRLITPTASAGPTASAAAGVDATPSARTPAATAAPTERPLAPTGQPVQVRVIQVVDGDTIVVMRGGKYVTVRYLGIDAPNVAAPKKPAERMGPEAAAANTKLVADKQVWIEQDASDTARDGSLLRYVWVVEGSRWTLVNLELVRLGDARAASSPPDTRNDLILSAAEREAKAAGLGLWARSGPTAKPTP
jgi:endonuclease YncB( thermonuclease family)